MSQLNSTREKVRQTCLERYGVDNPMKCTESVEKLSQSVQEHYSVLWPMQSDEVKKTSEHSYLEHYGVNHLLKSEQVQSKVKQTLQDRYGQTTPINVPEFREKYEKHTSGKLYEILRFKKIRIPEPGYVCVHLDADTYLTRVNC